MHKAFNLIFKLELVPEILEVLQALGLEDMFLEDFVVLAKELVVECGYNTNTLDMLRLQHLHY